MVGSKKNITIEILEVKGLTVTMFDQLTDGRSISSQFVDRPTKHLEVTDGTERVH